MPDPAPGRCNLCGAPAFETIYRSKGAHSLTSLCQLRPGGVEVFFCTECGHIGTTAFADVEAFYESDYTILTNSAEEDQIYETDGDRIVYRTDHQMKVLKEKVAVRPGITLLDYGSAKAEMSRRLKAEQPRIDVHLYDVSRMYLSFWDAFTTTDRQAIHRTPPDWNGRFDLVTSYFAFEHIPDPARAARHVAELLAPGGVFYMIVPDTFGNVADLIVADHVNHFTRASLARLLSDAGFGEAEIDAEAHRGAFVVTAVKGGTPPALAGRQEIAELKARALDLAGYWENAGARLAAAERAAAGRGRAAIYGAGFYGAFIYASLEEPGAVACFLDRNPFQQGRTLFDVPIVAPEDLPGDVATLYVGLNPAIARQALESATFLDRPGLTAAFLD
jgi:Methylase involved in ubiquinone/menaquinone biosynthesis